MLRALSLDRTMLLPRQKIALQALLGPQFSQADVTYQNFEARFVFSYPKSVY